MTPQQASEPGLDSLADMAKHGGIEYLFPTPVFWYVFKNVAALNAELLALILAQERANPSIVKSNQGGWQSPTDFFSGSGSAVATLRQFAMRAVEIATARLVRPEAGMIILFPGYLQHSVRMYQGERPRVCVPFNAHMRIVDTEAIADRAESRPD